MRAVIPVQLRGKKFVLYSAFHINIAVNNPLGVIVSIDLAGSTRSDNNKLRLGIAKPVNDDAFYSYTRGECSPHVIEYPEVSSLTYTLSSFDTANNVNIPANSIYTLDLWFEPID